MRPRTWALAALAMTLGCGGGSDEPKPDTVHMKTQAPVASTDAGVDADAVGTTAAAPAVAKSEGWVDPVPNRGTGWTPSSGRLPARKRRVVHITLRSTPPGAVAMVDGTTIGVTPTYWEGEATGKARNFVFTKRGYVMGRFRFVPTTDGTVHPELKRLAASETDAGPDPTAADTNPGSR